jgi:hypothetical protein
VFPAAACAGLGELVFGLSELVFGLSEPVAVPLDGVCGVGEVLSPGENEDDPAEVGVDPPEQAETAAEASMVMVPQPMTVSIALSPVPAMAVRTFMAPPHASRRVTAPVSRYQRQKPAPEGNTRDDPGRCPRLPEAGFPKAPAAAKVKPMDGTGTQ